MGEYTLRYNEEMRGQQQSLNHFQSASKILPPAIVHQIVVLKALLQVCSKFSPNKSNHRSLREEQMA